MAAGEQLKRAKKALGPTRARQARANAASAAELQARHSPEPKYSVGTRGRTGEHRHAPHPCEAASFSVQACQKGTWRRPTQWSATQTSYTKRLRASDTHVQRLANGRCVKLEASAGLGKPQRKNGGRQTVASWQQKRQRKEKKRQRCEMTSSECEQLQLKKRSESPDRRYPVAVQHISAGSAAPFFMLLHAYGLGRREAKPFRKTRHRSFGRTLVATTPRRSTLRARQSWEAAADTRV